VRGGLIPVLHRAVLSNRSAAKEAGVELQEDVPPELGDLERDEGRLEQVFRSLIADAIRLSPRGSTVRLAARPVARGVSCTVEDEGPGLPGEDAQRVFEPFFTRGKGGTGLALSIARRIVEEHGGSVVAGDRPGRGAVITVFLPFAAESATRGTS
jgi:signal transduction histidine kinase